MGVDADGKVYIEAELGTKTFEQQIEYLERKLNDMVADYNTMAEEENFNEQSEDAMKLKNDIEKLSNTINGYKQRMVEANEQTNRFSEITSKGFSKGINSLKKFALSMFGIQSIYRAVSRASSSYLSQDLELAEKLRSVWVGLGSFLQPALEAISNALLKGLGYLNVFVKALTGIDFIARANAKALEKQAKAQKNLNKQTYDFDVIRTQQDTSTSGGLSTSSGLIKIPELDDRLVTKLKDFAKTLKDNWWWIKKVGEALLLVFGAVAVAKFLGGIGRMLGSASLGTGLLGLQAILVAIAGAYVISMYIKNYQEIKRQIEEVKEAYDELSKSVESATKKDKENANAVWEAYEAGKIGKDGLENYKKALDLTTNSVLDQVNSLEKNKSSLFFMKSANEEITKSQQAFADELSNTVDEYKKLYDAGILTDKEYNDLIVTLHKAIPELEKNGLNVDKLKQKYENLTGQKYYVKVYAQLTDNVSERIKELIRQGVNVVLSSSGGGKGSKGYRNKGDQGRGGGGFALGGIVTQPTRALIGEAGYPEAVVPMTKDYLSTLAGLIAQYGGNSGSNTTNVYLDGRLIQRQVSNKQSQVDFATNR